MSYKNDIEKLRNKRKNKMRELREKGKTLTEIGNFFGITKQGVFEIIGKKEKREKKEKYVFVRKKEKPDFHL